MIRAENLMPVETIFRLVAMRHKCSRKDCRRRSTHFSVAVLDDGTVEIAEWCEEHGHRKVVQLREERASELGLH